MCRYTCIRVHTHVEPTRMGFVSEIGPLMGLTLQNMLNWPASLRDPLVSVSPVLELLTCPHTQPPLF